MSTEAELRQRIDDLLTKAGWNQEQGNLLKEHRLPDAPKRTRETQITYGSGPERTDYTLLGSNGKPIAIVEAKRDERDPLEGLRQVENYADHLFALYGVHPFLFLSNGYEHWFWDRSQETVPRRISGFFSPADIERLAFLNLYRRTLHTMTVNEEIAGKDRPYQREAIQHLVNAMEAQKKRKFLLVMATGTGKTRTIIGLVDLLIRARWVQRVLFLADRRELVGQAIGAFKEYLPNEYCVRVEGDDLDDSARIQVATYPSLMQRYLRRSPGYYDLIVADESHRSIYNYYKQMFDYFDAMQLGLTATPTDYIDHNTFETFGCTDGRLTYYYPYERAVKEGHLVEFKRVLDVQTVFQVEGIKAGKLSPDAQQYLENQGIDLDEIDFEGSDLERKVTNTGTHDALVTEFMEKCRKDARGTLPAKGIIFAVSHRHAMDLLKSFYRLYSDKPWLAAVIDSRVERADQLLDDFKRKEMPRVAISIDMLDTGIDIPAIQNLVFAKPVFSLVKFWQMIGRGTRLWKDPVTGEQKKNFLIIDHWKNFEYFEVNPDGDMPSLTAPLPVSLFRVRLEKLLLLRQREAGNATAGTVIQLQQMLAQLPRENVNVSSHHKQLETLARQDAWDQIEGSVETINTTIAPLLRLVSDVNYLEMTFAIQTEQLAVALLKGEQEKCLKLRGHIQRALLLLPTGLPQIQALAEKMRWMLSDGFWDHLTYERVLDLQLTFTPLMRYRRTEEKSILTLNLPDSIFNRRWIIYGPSGEGAFVDTYREQVETHINNLAEQVPTLYKIKHALADESPSLTEMQSIAATLNRPDLFITEEVLRRVYERSDVDLLDFLHHILGKRRFLSREEQVKADFEKFLAQHSYFTVTQADFIRVVRSMVLRQKRLTSADLEHPPFSRVGAAQRLFSQEEITKILEFANRQVA